MTDSLKNRLQDDLTAAMKASDELSKSTLRMLLAAVMNAEVAGKEAVTLNDAQVIAVLRSEAKKRVESAEVYEQAGRNELADKEKAELSVIEEFLPKQMSEEETRAAIATIKGEIGAEGMKDMGRLMGELKSRHGASLDMSKASGLVKASLT